MPTYMDIHEAGNPVPGCESRKWRGIVGRAGSFIFSASGSTFLSL